MLCLQLLGPQRGKGSGPVSRTAPAPVAGTARVLRVSSSGVGQMKRLVGNVPRASRRGRTLLAHVSQKDSNVSRMFIHALGV